MVPYRTVFKDESKLDINYIPQILPHREKEQRLLKEFFSFMLYSSGKMAQRVIITGDVGTGKTALCQRFGEDLTSEANKRAVKFHYLHVNCRDYRGTLSQILHHAVAVFERNYPSRGYASEEILKALLGILEAENAFIILTLDEFDSVIEREGSDAVYKLTRLQEMQPGKPQRVSFIFIMRDFSAVERLDASARSTLQRNIISLERYGKEQLVDILNNRVFMAFEVEAVPEDVVDLIAELAFSESGNARFGIELLWRAGKYADADDADSVEAEYVRQAVSNVIPGFKKSDLTNLSLHERLFLLAVARFFKESPRAYASLVEVEKAYAVVCEEYGEAPQSHTQLWTYVKFLSAVGIVKTEVATASTRGRSTRISLPAIPAVELEKELSAYLEKGRE